MGHHRLPRAARPGQITPPVTASDRPRLLFVTPILPALTGNGLAMRAGATLRALARDHRVTLLAAPQAGVPDAALPAAIAAACERIVLAGGGGRLPTRRHFDVVHLFTLAAWPEAAPWLPRAAAIQIDLPVLESVVQRRLAILAHETGRSEAARLAEQAAERAARLEEAALAQFGRIWVSSEAAREALLRRHAAGAEVVVLPQTLPAPAITPFPPPDRGSFVLLFVGTLNDPANEDALQHFTASILPRIQAGANRPVTLRIVGRGASPAVRRLGGQAGVEVIGEVADVAPWYRDAHLAVIPIRAGGGMPIKALEAFVHRRPVVATSLGLEGIAAEDGRHALIADEPGRFATAALRLLHDAPLADAMATEAFALFTQAYTEGRMANLPPIE